MYCLLWLPWVLVWQYLTCDQQFFWISKILYSWKSYLLELWFLTGSYLLGKNWVFQWIIQSRNHFWFKNIFILILIITLSEYLYNFLMFYIHLLSYKALLLNDWYTTIVAENCFSRSDWRKPFRMTNLCSNHSISDIVSVNLANTFDYLHCASQKVFTSIWKNIYSFFNCRKIYFKIVT